jgi:hypothetical protein
MLGRVPSVTGCLLHDQGTIENAAFAQTLTSTIAQRLGSDPGRVFVDFAAAAATGRRRMLSTGSVLAVNVTVDGPSVSTATAVGVLSGAPLSTSQTGASTVLSSTRAGGVFRALCNVGFCSVGF